MWVGQIAHAEDGWVPLRFEWAFGLKGGGAVAATDVGNTDTDFVAVFVGALV